MIITTIITSSQFHPIIIVSSVAILALSLSCLLSLRLLCWPCLPSMLRAEDMTYDDLKQTTEGWVVRMCSAVVTPLQAALFTPKLLPMDPLWDGDNERVHWVDYVQDYETAIDIAGLQNAYKEAASKCNWNDLPEPFGFKDPTAIPEGTKLQINVFTQPTGKSFIVKHCVFKNKMKPSIFKTQCYGNAHKLRFTHPKIGVRVWQYMFQNLGGYSFLSYELSSEATKAATGSNSGFNLSDKTDEDIDAGFQYIQREARGLNGVRLLLWQTKALKNDTPIKGWPIQLTKEVVRLIVTEGTLVRKETQWPLTLTAAHFQKWFLEIMEDLYEFDIAALGLLGVSETGKSPAGRTVLLSQCRYNKAHLDTQHEPSIRVTTEFDLLRGEMGNVVMADFLDDGAVYTIVLKALLAFTDVGLFEAMAWARWGCTKWIQKQPRGFSDNAFYPIDTKNEWPWLDHKEFVEVIRPSIYQQATAAHVEALLKRVAYVVVADEWVAWRRAGTEQDQVRRRFLKKAEFLTDLGKEWYGKYKSGCRDLPANHSDLVAEEQEWVGRVLQKNRQRRLNKYIPSTMRGPSLFEEKKDNTPEFVKVKQEKVTRVFAKLRADPMREVISLDSPSPKKKLCLREESLAAAIHQSRVDAGMPAGSSVSRTNNSLDNPELDMQEFEDDDC